MAGRYYIYKLYFKNGCTYIGKHFEKKPDDGYITSSGYYAKHVDLLERRDILLEVPDMETLDIMETICILEDVANNPKNVNYNRGAWMDPSKFDRGYSGEANGMYGRKMVDVMGKEAYEAFLERNRKAIKERYEKKYGEFKRTHDGLTPSQWKIKKRSEHTKLLDSINRQIREAHKAYKHKMALLPHFWQYNPETLEESYSSELKEGWIKGRLPYEYWPEERKQSYREKHIQNPFANKSPEWMEDYKIRIANKQQGKKAYTNGVNNRYLLQGQEIPEGYYPGVTFTKSELYWATRPKKKEDK